MLSPGPHRRLLQAGVLSALGDTPAVCLYGAARTGKTTLLRALQAHLPEAACHSLADPATLAQVTRDPLAFLNGLPALTFLDDAERAPTLLPLLRSALAGGRKFLLTTPRLLPGLADCLSWSLASFTLWPLAQAEREGILPGLIDACFGGDPTRLRLAPETRQDLLERLLAGGYPEVADRTPAGRETWFHGYLEAQIHGRLGILTDLRDVHALTRLLAAPDADPGRARRCRDLLVEAHILAAVASGSGAPHPVFNDAALQAHVLGLAPGALATRPTLAEPLLDTFAAMELVKTAPWSVSRPSLSRLRTGAQELMVLEDHSRQLVAFTVCAAATVQPEALQGLQALRGEAGDRLRAGVVLHAGGTARAAGPGFWVLPFQALWAPRD